MSTPENELSKSLNISAMDTPPTMESAVKREKQESGKKRKVEVAIEAQSESPNSLHTANISGSDARSERIVKPAATKMAHTTPTQSPLMADDSTEEPPSKKRKASIKEIEVNIAAPEPPSKKALRRLKKGKPLPPSKSGVESSPEPEVNKEKKSEVEKRSEYGVWIGNLPWSASKEELKKLLVENSDIKEDMITRVHMPSLDDGKSAYKVDKKKFGKKVHNKGFAYVDFSSAQGVEQAVELSEQLLSGRRVLIKNNKSFEGRPQKTKDESRNDGKPPSKRVFLGNLNFDTTEDSIKDHFEKCGRVESVKIATFEDSGKCKGYAWVVFEELEAAQNAVRGFVRIKEEASDKSESEIESEVDSDAEAAVSKSKLKKTKTRKWWVNRIKGRPLRMEFAEDAQVRYKKRYGKEGTKRGKPFENAEQGVKENVKNVEYRQLYVARLTSGIVESKGKKTTF